jgi:23S rRNA (cytidine1920-2'-O)/16S rRNA (cytidine1409-2'-O)-methyltransferase
MAKQRLDELMVTRGLVATPTEARALIMAGQVSADGRRLDKPGMAVDAATELHVKDQPKYVSRAGDKLASVASGLGLDFGGKVVLDVGSSTGGFTDFVLQNGAVKVYCVDVGTGQLAYKLRQDPRVVVMEQTDIRDVGVGDDLRVGTNPTAGSSLLPGLVDMAVMDVSFISLIKVLEKTAELVRPGGEIVAMAKPQFEATRAVADKYHGVIPLGPERDEIINDLREWMRERFELVGESDSGVAGAEGNIEHFFYLRRPTNGK